MSLYFDQIVFPSLTSSPEGSKKQFVFWFEDIEKQYRKKLMTQCQICNHIYTFLDFVIEDHARNSLKLNIDNYVKYSEMHCPICHPSHPVNLGDAMIFLLRKV